MARQIVLPPGCYESQGTRNGIQYRAVLSMCGSYRYELERIWSNQRLLIFIGLNPSRGDGISDDPTIRRCMRFAKDRGYGGMRLVNLFAFRSPDPLHLLIATDNPVGPCNVQFLELAAKTENSTILAAWGRPQTPLVRRRADAALALMSRNVRWVYCLGLTKDGSPRHPLYVRANAQFDSYRTP